MHGGKVNHSEHSKVIYASNVVNAAMGRIIPNDLRCCDSGTGNNRKMLFADFAARSTAYRMTLLMFVIDNRNFKNGDRKPEVV